MTQALKGPFAAVLKNMLMSTGGRSGRTGPGVPGAGSQSYSTGQCIARVRLRQCCAVCYSALDKGSARPHCQCASLLNSK